MTDHLSDLTAEELREKVVNELSNAGWTKQDNLLIPPIHNGDKSAIRTSHWFQRVERAQSEVSVVKKYGQKLLTEFASGYEVNPLKFKPSLSLVDSKSADNLLFRFATLLWSVPVSAGYGRRMRYLVRDEYNGKLVGIFALMDPVFNLKVRDQHIGWNKYQREDRLYNVMDAYVLGAVPPYNMLLGGKMIALAAISNEVRNAFYDKYNGRETVIRKAHKDASLVLVTTTSALGRSSIYNRIKINNETSCVYQSLGFSRGWGHYHFSEDTFLALRRWLQQTNDPYADGYTWDKSRESSGPNWRIRVIRKALTSLGFDNDLLRHGIQREVFLAPTAKNYREYLCGIAKTPEYYDRSLDDLSSYFIDRWMKPRSKRIDAWQDWSRLDTWKLIRHNLGNPEIITPTLSLF